MEQQQLKFSNHHRQGQQKSLQFLVSARVVARVGILLFLCFLLRNDVQLPQKLLDRFEFCRAVL